MKARPVIFRDLARQDTDDALEYYLGEGAESAAVGFIDALEGCLNHIARNPAAGSLRYAHELDIPGLRCHTLKRYPHLVFYIEHADHVDVWRVLHSKRNIPGWLRSSDEPDN